MAERILSSRTRGYEGNLVERVGEITADLVIGAWPQVGEAAVADVVSRGEPDNLKMVPYPAHLWRWRNTFRQAPKGPGSSTSWTSKWCITLWQREGRTANALIGWLEG